MRTILLIVAITSTSFHLVSAIQRLARSHQVSLVNNRPSINSIIFTPAQCQQLLVVTSHIAWELGYVYMYKRTLLDTTRFKAVMAMNLLELCS